MHRDIKPDNIVIGPIDNVDTLYLIDFGLAKKFVNKNGLTCKNTIYQV